MIPWLKGNNEGPCPDCEGSGWRTRKDGHVVRCRTCGGCGLKPRAAEDVIAETISENLKENRHEHAG